MQSVGYKRRIKSKSISRIIEFIIFFAFLSTPDWHSHEVTGVCSLRLTRQWMIHALRLIWPIFLLSFFSHRDGKLLGEIRHYSRNVITPGVIGKPSTVHWNWLFSQKLLIFDFFSMTFNVQGLKKPDDKSLLGTFRAPWQTKIVEHIKFCCSNCRMPPTTVRDIIFVYNGICSGTFTIPFNLFFFLRHYIHSSRCRTGMRRRSDTITLN